MKKQNNNTNNNRSKNKYNEKKIYFLLWKKMHVIGNDIPLFIIYGKNEAKSNCIIKGDYKVSQAIIILLNNIQKEEKQFLLF